MKMHFTVIIEGNDTMEKKFEQSLKDNPNLHLDLLRALTSSILISFRFNDEDKISVNSFRAGKIDENPVQVEINKKVDK